MTLTSVFSIYKPYFSFKPESRQLWFLALLLCFGNLFQAILIVISNNLLNAFLAIIICPTFSFSALGWVGMQYLSAVFVHTLAAGFNSYIGDKIIEYFNRVILNTFDEWMQSKTYFGAQFLNQRKVVNGASIFSYDIQEANRLTVRLTDNFLNTFFASLAGLYGLWQLSFPLSLEIGSFILIIPGYMAIGALIYAVVNNLIIRKFAHQLEEVTEKQYLLANKLEAQVHHVEKHAEGITLLNAANREQKNFVQMLKQTTIYNTILAKLQACLTAFIALNDHLRYFVGISLCIPQILAKKMSVDNLLVVSDYFTRITNVFTWQYDNYEDLAYLKVMSSKLKSLEKEIAQWKEIQGQHELNIEQGEELAFKSLVINKRDQDPLLNCDSFEFKKAKITLIQGPSGVGKSTIIKTISKSWPYATGKIVLPCDRKDLHIIPQKTVFPRQSTLYEAILYPRDQELLTKANKQKIDELLVEFKFGPNVINEKEEVRYWGNTLSGGEQQRVALLRFILFKPKVLLMDEPLSALNPELQTFCEKLLRKHIKNSGATVLLIDHRDTSIAPAPGSFVFHDDIVHLADRKLTRGFS
ncbi:MAG: ATP-binding cassette domain-containing protein [Proteobacteria bacterium]|nr:ATP-binding cassette domain-containing protein [Pseudomonadota bacterium]